MEKFWYLYGENDSSPYVETVVSRLRNSRFLPWKLLSLMPETTVPRLETGS